MSDDSSCNKLNKTIKNFNDYLAKVLQNPIATRVKIADVKNNLSRLGNIEDKELRNKLETKYKKALEVLGES